MKKITILGLCLAVGIGASAQMKLAKEVERNTKNNFNEAVKQMTPIFSNPETEKEAFPRYVVGKAGFGEYDDMFAKKQLNMPTDDKAMGKALLGGYDYMMQAIALDTVVDAKGKVKTKHSKDIINTVGGHFNDFTNMAVYLWNVEDYKGAYDSWQVYVDLTKDPRFAKTLDKMMPADTMIQNIIFNQALAAFNMKDHSAALDKFMEVMDYGPAKKHVYDYALSVAQELDKNDTILAICEKAIPLYGNEDSLYLINVINVYNRKGDAENAFKKIEEAIQQQPDNAQLWRVKGYLYEYKEDYDNALSAYEKAIQVDPKFVMGIYDYARSLYNKGMRTEDATSQADYAKVQKETIMPLYRQAKDLLVKATELAGDDQNVLSQIEKLMDNLNYKLGEE